MALMMSRQTEMHTAAPLVPEPSCFEVEIEIQKLKKCESPDMKQIPAKLIHAGVI
jgi:hypothetical protein